MYDRLFLSVLTNYEYFNYSVYEALYLSDKEETMITGIAKYIEQEWKANKGEEIYS